MYLVFSAMGYVSPIVIGLLISSCILKIFTFAGLYCLFSVFKVYFVNYFFQF